MGVIYESQHNGKDILKEAIRILTDQTSVYLNNIGNVNIRESELRNTNI